jgi:APA family basic amino acid/polyamine antiporter
MMVALAVTTVLYVLITLVLTGMVPFHKLAVGDPLAFVFQEVHLNWIAGIISISAIVAMASVLLVFQVGQPRIWMSMSRDGLLPPRFSRIHPRFRTPAFSTVVTGVLVAVPALFLNLTEVTDLTSIGTIFAFIVVSFGILVIPPESPTENRRKRFRIPYLNSRYYLPPLLLLLIIALFWFNFDGICQFAGTFGAGHWTSEHLPFLVFLTGASLLSVWAWLKQFSLIPVLSILTNLYLMSELGWTNWLRFLVWLLIGLLIYFLYGYKHSRMGKMEVKEFQ